MDTSYAMAKFRLESKDILRSRQKGCWHYMKYVFIFSSIIQFLIILGLVLFMLYGNAHGGTELRLKSVENRYKDLTIDHAWLKGNFSLLKEKLASADKNLKNCSDTLSRTRMSISTMNKTAPCPRFPPISTCHNLQIEKDNLNMTCKYNQLRAENEKILFRLELSQYKENCSKTITDYATKDSMVSSEIVQLQREKKDLGTQIHMLQESCTKIDEKFRQEVQSLKSYIEAAVPSGNPYDSTLKCRPISDLVNRQLDFTLGKLRQDVNVVVYENTQLQVMKARINEDLEKCKQDKATVTTEKNNIATEKTSLEKELAVKKDEFTKSYAQYLRKDEDLALCRRQQTRPQFPPQFPPRT
ncbi:plasmalemma vesicle-associated protein [Rana temporaria]|uniref:plasmalemma vesicle-associated protein n=1 Tax=Rana temporaria TaxID=8407 RepID=UPI001AAD547A|nr:plasmalemma vesicle-associated protein [Rana temporaria]